MKDLIRSRAWLLALVAVAMLVAAGCGGGDDDSSSSDTAAAGDTGGGAAADQTMSIGWGAEPPSLDPGLATDTTSSNVLLNIMDPLVKLNDDLQPVPSLAESWTVKGPNVTFKLRKDGKWTNGDPVTAKDFVYSWKRTLSPDLAADYAYQLYGIKGAQEYNGCKSNCAKLKDKVAVTAPDDYTLKVQLTSPQPWFVQQAAHHSFLAVHKPTIDKFGDKWTEPQNIVTDGPFKLEAWNHDQSIDLVKNPDWRDADDVKLERVNGKIIVDGTTRVQSFEAGEINALDGGGLPTAEIPRLKGESFYVKYPALGTYYYGINVKNIPDRNQRLAMSFSIDRQSIIDNIAQEDQIPATSMSPEGLKEFETIHQDFLPTTADMAKAKEYMAKVKNPKKNIGLYLNDSPGHKEIAVAVQAQWKELGLKTTIKSQEWAQFLEFLGPPPNKAVDVYRSGWIGDFPDAINFLELWTCDSGNNSTNWCSPPYDNVIAQAKRTPDNAKRWELYKKAEQMLTGPNGAQPFIPLYWYTYTNLEDDAVRDTFTINPLDQFDLTKVTVKG